MSMTIQQAIENRERCLKYLEGCAVGTNPESVEAVRLSLEALREKAEREDSKPLTIAEMVMPNTVKVVEIDHVKEKLIELLVNSPGLCTLSGKEEEFAENADWLIANGVTVTTGISFECKYVDEDGCPQTIRRMIKVLTNADRIRAMNDDLLATQLTQIFHEGVLALTKVKLPNEILNEIRTQTLEKLQQPAEEVNDECSK